jgi:hypothetical protein
MFPMWVVYIYGNKQEICSHVVVHEMMPDSELLNLAKATKEQAQIESKQVRVQLVKKAVCLPEVHDDANAIKQEEDR